MTASERLVAWRQAKGYSQQEAAEVVGVSQASWSNWETGRKRPDLRAAVAIERATKRAVRACDWLEADRGHDATVTPEPEASNG